MGSDPFIGEISIFAGNYAPQGWAICDGRTMQIIQYQALFAIIGNMYGGDGRTTFALPDLRGRSALGVGAGTGLSPRTIAQSGGQERVAIGVNELPIHNHPAQATLSGMATAKLNALGEVGSSPTPAGSFIANHANAFLRTGTSVQMNGGSITVETSGLQVGANIGNAGGNASHENMHPFLALNYIIALEGIFPPRE
jgi:microcystin-dependent protein